MNGNRPIRSMFLAVLITITGARTAWGWGDGGHMLVALHAWQVMTPEQRTGAVSLLRQHPRFQKEFTTKMPAGLSAEDQNLWLFMYAATWPDYVWQVRLTEPRDFYKYFHSSWHTIGEPVALDPQMQNSVKPLRPATLPAMPTTQDLSRLTILEALPLVTADLDNAQLSPQERAVALCWVIHLTGDLHEPCHAASLFCRRFSAYDGDHVATRLPIDVNGKTKTMHSLWDSLIGGSTDLAAQKAEERDLAGDPRLQRDQLPELTQDITVASWVQESFHIALGTVYDANVRSAIAAQESNPQSPFVPVKLSEEYLVKARIAARRQGALAGFRLADTLAKVPW
jgi:S1/P1 Nuclease